MNLKAPGMRVPMVDIVFPYEESDLDVVFVQRVRKLIGALQRRFWDRRREMLHARALGAEQASTETAHQAPSGMLLADFADPLLDWAARLKEYRTVVAASRGIDLDVDPSQIRIRGWNETEAGILVDGRAVPGCIVDVAVALVHTADSLRSGRQGFVIHVPTPSDTTEAKLWADLLNVAQDRLGIERGTVEFVVDGQPLLDASSQTAAA